VWSEGNGRARRRQSETVRPVAAAWNAREARSGALRAAFTRKHASEEEVVPHAQRSMAMPWETYALARQAYTLRRGRSKARATRRPAPGTQNAAQTARESQRCTVHVVSPCLCGVRATQSVRRLQPPSLSPCRPSVRGSPAQRVWRGSAAAARQRRRFAATPAASPAQTSLCGAAVARRWRVRRGRVRGQRGRWWCVRGGRVNSVPPARYALPAAAGTQARRRHGAYACKRQVRRHGVVTLPEGEQRAWGVPQPRPLQGTASTFRPARSHRVTHSPSAASPGMPRRNTGSGEMPAVLNARPAVVWAPGVVAAPFHRKACKGSMKRAQETGRATSVMSNAALQACSYVAARARSEGGSRRQNRTPGAMPAGAARARAPGRLPK